MLKGLFEWLDAQAWFYWLPAGAATLLLAAWLWAAVRAVSALPARASHRGGNRVAAVVLVLFLFAWRWPYLLIAHELNPDESQFIAGALTLVHDPVFWRSVDGTTSGPLNFYALLPLAWLGVLDYFTARVTGLLLVAAALVLCHRLLTRAFGPAVGALGVLPATVFFATATDPNLLHYSSELVLLPLIAGAACLLIRRGATIGGGSTWNVTWAALLAGAAPWAKMQAAPISLALIAWALWQSHHTPAPEARERRWRIAHVLLAALTPTLVMLAVVLAAGQGEHLLRRYFLHNLLYVQAGAVRTAPLTRMMEHALWDRTFPLFLIAAILPLLAGAVAVFRTRTKPHALWFAGALLTAAAALAVVLPRRDFLHYLLLLVVPLTLWQGAAIGDLWTQVRLLRLRRLLGGGFLVLGGLIPVALRCLQPAPAIFGEFADHWRHPRSVEASLARALTEPGERVAVWGWASAIHAESRRHQATRDAHVQGAIVPNPQQRYYRMGWLADFQRSDPPVFVDAVGPGAFAFGDRAAHGHESFPALADHIRRHYALVTDLVHARVYLRTDRPPLTQASLKALVHRSRPAAPVALAPHALSPPDAGRHTLDGRTVQMLPPPAEARWTLNGNERAVVIDYGVHPDAPRPDGEADSVEFVVDLRSPGQPARPVFHHRLEPAQNPGERGPQGRRITLPPFSAGTELVVRTTRAEAYDSGGEAYLAGARFHFAPVHLPEQFPRFSPTPDAAAADLAHLVDDHLRHEGRQKLLMLPAPASIGYSLAGDERELIFAYGFQPGAHQAGGRTDGAIYRVELERAGKAAEMLFERHLEPLGTPADRGRQESRVVLAGARAGDRLVLRILPGASNSWDWTYLTDVVLQ